MCLFTKYLIYDNIPIIINFKLFKQLMSAGKSQLNIHNLILDAKGADGQVAAGMQDVLSISVI